MTGSSNINIQEFTPFASPLFWDSAESAASSHVEMYAVLPSSSQQRWLVPAGNRALALSGLDVYQPYGVLGGAIKRALAVSIRCGLNLYARKTLGVSAADAGALRRLIENVTGERDCGFALLIGNFGRYRKATIQVMTPAGDVLGYLKVPLTSEADERVRNEGWAVAQVAQIPGLKGRVPEVLFAGEWNGRYVLLQEPLRGRPSRPVFEPAHDAFLGSLARFGRVDRPAESLIGEVAGRTRNLSILFAPDDFDAVLRVARGWLGTSTVECGYTHGDFAPWNMRVSHDGLQVFDWERAGRDLPLAWDYFHFITQAEILLNIRTQQRRRKLLQRQGTPAERATYLLYLLQSAATLVDEGVPVSDRAVTTRRGWIRELLKDSVS